MSSTAPRTTSAAQTSAGTQAPSTASAPSTWAPEDKQRPSLQWTPWSIAFLIAVAITLIGSVIPMGQYGPNLWTAGSLFLLGIGALFPLIAAGLVVAQLQARATGGQAPRLGSLSVEQVGHVASWLAFASFFTLFVTTLEPATLVGLIGSLGMVFLSPLRFLFGSALGSQADRPLNTTRSGAGAGTKKAAAGSPASAQTTTTTTPAATSVITPASGSASTETSTGRADTADRAETAADQGSAGQTSAAAQGFGIEDSAGPAPLDQDSAELGADPDAETTVRRTPGEEVAAGGDVVGNQGRQEPQAAGEPRYEAFWFAVGTPRHTVNPDGSQAFLLEPGNWILALEDRGHEFLVQNTDGRTAVLRDLGDVERA